MMMTMMEVLIDDGDDSICYPEHFLCYRVTLLVHLALQ